MDSKIIYIEDAIGYNSRKGWCREWYAVVKRIGIADYLFTELDKLREPDPNYDGQKETWTRFFSRRFDIKFLPRGISRRTNGKVGRPLKKRD